MDDEKGLDLSLGLPCGGNSSSQKSKYGSSSDIKSDEGDRGSKLINEFKNFLEGGNNQQHSIKVGENFYNSFGKSAADLETSKNSNTGGGGIWLTNDSRSTEFVEDKRSSVGEKRKHLFIETNQEKKHERDAASHVDLTDKTKTSHISITTDEGSTADNEDVAESEVDGSTSRHVPSGSSEKNFNVMNMPMAYSTVPLRGQPVNMNTNTLSSQPMKDSNTSGTTPGNFPLMFGYNPVQLPSLDRDNSKGNLSHHQEMHHPTYSGRNSLNHDTQNNDSRKITQGISHKETESTTPSSHTEGEEVKGYNQLKKDAPDQARAAAAELIPGEFPAIRPGIAGEVKFGGCGSYPNLPWVSTTGQGPNGRTISGVTYRFSPTQIRIVCACHGSHMSPEEFVRHASAEESQAPDALTSLPSSNPAASAQS
ncbi:Ninja-family protein mc410 [Striga asiatica]|uniref:Ninja-family protein n=1 Tax=Striga asiatica TaxID=4170 RepID=A0A5A7QTN6_STRAF|nr:Ninja-family protein mc410 [Striga asiatica]